MKKTFALFLALLLTLGLCAAEAPAEESWQVGSFVSFGRYAQNADGEETPLEWLVLENDGCAALLISRYVLEYRSFHDQFQSVTWEKSSLRRWLNGDFLNQAFTADEQARIFLVDVIAEKNPQYSTNPGANTKDKVFLPSLSDMKDFFHGDRSRMAAATVRALGQAPLKNDFDKVDGQPTGSWWLRAPGNGGRSAAFVDTDGAVERHGAYVDTKNGVRPCVWVRLPEAVEIYRIGESVTFGRYPQTESGDDDTPIKWTVVNLDGDTALLISRHVLDCQPYHAEYVHTPWASSSLRQWLNADFANRAFTSEEKTRIVPAQVKVDFAPWGAPDSGSDTVDDVFLLSVAEAEQIFLTDEIRVCAPTAYAIRQGVYTEPADTETGLSCWWWLRSFGSLRRYAAEIASDGSVERGGECVNYDRVGVRPCVWVRIP